MIKREDLDVLIDRIDKAARAEDGFEYGLPIHNVSARAVLREIVREWLAELGVAA